MTEQLEFLTSFLKNIGNQIPNIGNGGCGFFARSLSKQLIKLNIPYKIIARFGLWDEQEDNLKRYLRSGNVHDGNREFTAAHVVIEVDGIYLDHDGYSEENGKLYRESVEISMKNLEDMIEYSDWNPQFDRSNVPEIEEMLNALPEAYQQRYSLVIA
jgi:hypothetical protein